MSAITGVEVVMVDCLDPPGLARWWQGLVGGEVTVDQDGDAVLRAPGQPRLTFLGVPEGKTVKNRLHLDLGTTDLSVAVEEALGHGAVLAADINPPNERFVVLRDPAGNEFCLLAPGTSGH